MMRVAGRAVMLDEDDRTSGGTHLVCEEIEPADQPGRVVPRSRRTERALLQVDHDQGIGHRRLPDGQRDAYTTFRRFDRSAERLSIMI
jgi:hypothetical protein